jgi:phage protein D
MSAVEVTVNGAALSEADYDALIDVRVEQSVHVPDRFALRFRDPNFSLIDSDRFRIGATVDIAFSNGEHEAVVLRGEITSLGAEQNPMGRHELVVSGLDRGHRLARGSMWRTFVTMTDSNVASQIAGERGLTADVDSSSVTHDYLLQRGTDYAFLTERARAIGFDWWVNGDKLYFKRDAKLGPGPTLRYGEDLLRFKVRASAAEAADEVVVRGWNPDTQQAIVGKSTMSEGGDGVVLGTNVPLAEETLSGASAFGNGITRGTGVVGVKDATEADALARAMAASATSEYVMAKGEALGNPLIRAGTEIEVDGVGAKLSGRYLLTTVEHVLGEHQYVTRFVSGGRQADTLVDLLGGNGAGAPGGIPLWGERGVVIGIVTNNKDPEGLSRIKVRFPTLSETDESWWARVAAIGAGTQRGLSVLFEIDDEVLVAFEHGDVRRPIVLGGLWSKKNKPFEGGKETDTEGVASRVWRSRTGHTMSMHDSGTPAKSFVAIALADGRTQLRMGRDNVSIDSPTDVTITSEASITLKASRDITIEGANVTVKAQQAMSLEAVNVSGKATASMNLEGAQSALKGSASVNVDGGALASVKGALVKLN